MFFKSFPSSIDLHDITNVSDFHLICLSKDPELQSILFGLFLSMYLVTVLGNLFSILVISSDGHLHIPMYFFLCNLCFADICFISTTVPKMIMDIKTHSRVTCYMGCLIQLSLFMLCACMDDMLLTVMAYDWFVAICHPLHYSVIMNPRLCVFSVILSVSASILDSLLHTSIVSQLTCFKHNEISNFFCHPSDLLNLASSDTLASNMAIYFLGTIFSFFPISGILWSYCRIISSILKISPSGGRYKAFSTCGSHLLVVCLFYGTGIGTYLGSCILPSPGKGMVASLMYTVVTPMLNPFIYNLRNRDIRNAAKRLHLRAVKSVSNISI